MQNHWSKLPPEVQNYIITLANCQAIHDQNKATGRDKVLNEIRDYGKLKYTWGHGHIYLSFGSWKPLGSYVYIAGYYKGLELVVGCRQHTQRSSRKFV